MYEGYYENDLKQGYGKYIWSNGSVYEGYFKNLGSAYCDNKALKGLPIMLVIFCIMFELIILYFSKFAI